MEDERPAVKPARPEGAWGRLAACVVAIPAALWACGAPAAAPEPLRVDEVLVAPGGDWYRSAWAVDDVEAALALGRRLRPVEGDSVRSLEGAGTWRRVVADSAGWIAADELASGWAYAVLRAPRREIRILEGFGYRMATVNGEPRTGNPYGSKDAWQAWEPRFDFSRLPVLLEAGENELLFAGSRAGALKARLEVPEAPLFLNDRDVTLPDRVVGEPLEAWGAIVVVNATAEAMSGLAVAASLEGGPEPVTGVPGLLPCSVRKAAFRIAAPAATAPGSSRLLVRLLDENGGELDRVERDLPVRERSANRRVTFRSGIDGSVQFYGWLPARRDSTFPVPALVLSLHGAAVDAHAQSGSYASKSWAHVAAPTNRRPFGYNWEDWGRLDALEVLEHVRARHRFDPDRVYLTGHSMGGHGTWHLGVLHPDLFAAVGPSAGWISFWSYRPERAIEPATEVERLLVRATAPSRTLDLADNLAELGVYVLHGDADDNVPVEQARLMARRLGGFHRDWVLHEQEEAGHWWDDGEEPGAACVDWPPMFDFFARHARGGTQRASAARFVTPDPGVSSTFRWVTVEAQSRALLVSRVDLRAEPHLRRITGSTENVARLSLSTEALAGEGPLRVTLDGDSLFANPEGGRVTLARGPRGWTPVPPAPASQKGPHRAGTFKDAFRNRVLFVAGTAGDEAEDARALAKARFDAEQFWYDGNGSVDVVTDVAFDPASEPDRNVVLYGNASTNRAWRALLADSPVQVSSGEVRVGSRRWRGPDLGVLLIRPRPGSEVASVAAVAASGPAGARLLERRPYLSPGFAFPDVTVFRAPRRAEAAGVAIAAGYFGNDWSLETGELVTE